MSKTIVSESATTPVEFYDDEDGRVEPRHAADFEYLSVRIGGGTLKRLTELDDGERALVIDVLNATDAYAASSRIARLAELVAEWSDEEVAERTGCAIKKAPWNRATGWFWGVTETMYLAKYFGAEPGAFLVSLQIGEPR